MRDPDMNHASLFTHHSSRITDHASLFTHHLHASLFTHHLHISLFTHHLHASSSHSALSASIGSRPPALRAGKIPKKTPITVESANASTGAHSGKTDGNGENRPINHDRP